MSLIFEYSDVSSANILHIDFKPSGKLDKFMLIKNNKGPKTEPCGTLVEYQSILMFAH